MDSCWAEPDARQIQAVWGLGLRSLKKALEGEESSLGPGAEGCKLPWDLERGILEFHGLLGCLVPSQGDSSCTGTVYSAEHPQPPL